MIGLGTILLVNDAVNFPNPTRSTVSDRSPQNSSLMARRIPWIVVWRLPTCLPLPLIFREDLRLYEYLERPHAAQALHIYKYPCLLWDSNPDPTAQQSASLTTMRLGG
ncbi:uncharacterized protein TNCV_4457441 [Trichonephila clavipes]|nr:uncharacterized protein TNCV_4457441 [Trichonephila clavipes]